MKVFHYSRQHIFLRPKMEEYEKKHNPNDIYSNKLEPMPILPVVLKHFCKIFYSSSADLLTNRYSMASRFPDLNRYAFFLWRYLKAEVYKNHPPILPSSLWSRRSKNRRNSLRHADKSSGKLPGTPLFVYQQYICF